MHTDIDFLLLLFRVSLLFIWLSLARLCQSGKDAGIERGLGILRILLTEHWCIEKVFKQFGWREHHSPPQNHFLSGLPVYTCCPRWAGWPIFLWRTIPQPITGKIEDKSPQSCLLYTETRTAEARAQPHSAWRKKAAVGPVKIISAPLRSFLMLRNLFPSFSSISTCLKD